MSFVEGVLPGTDRAIIRGPWHDKPRPICPKVASALGFDEPDECDCGHVGMWQFRKTFAAGDASVALGFEERCPGCGDIEFFTDDGTRIGHIGRAGSRLPTPRGSG